jgi:hypothetical protein
LRAAQKAGHLFQGRFKAILAEKNPAFAHFSTLNLGGLSFCGWQIRVFESPVSAFELDLTAAKKQAITRGRFPLLKPS